MIDTVDDMLRRLPMALVVVAALLTWAMASIGASDTARFVGSHVHTYGSMAWLDMPAGHTIAAGLANGPHRLYVEIM
jgi:hypothetical protein